MGPIRSSVDQEYEQEIATMSRTSIRLMGVAALGLACAGVLGLVSRSIAEPRPDRGEIHRVPYKPGKSVAFIIRGEFTDSTNGGAITITPAPGYSAPDGNWKVGTAKRLKSGNLFIPVTTTTKITQKIKGSRPKDTDDLSGTGQLLVTTDDPGTMTTIDVEVVDVDPCGNGN